MDEDLLFLEESSYLNVCDIRPHDRQEDGNQVSSPEVDFNSIASGNYQFCLEDKRGIFAFHCRHWFNMQSFKFASTHQQQIRSSDAVMVNLI
jgi:hypothetical protein